MRYCLLALFTLAIPASTSLAAQARLDTTAPTYGDVKFLPFPFKAHTPFEGREPEGIVMAGLEVGIGLAIDEYGSDKISSINIHVPGVDSSSLTAQRLFRSLHAQWPLLPLHNGPPDLNRGSSHIHVYLRAYDLLPSGGLLIEGGYGCERFLCSVFWRAYYSPAPLEPSGWSVVTSLIVARS